MAGPSESLPPPPDYTILEAPPPYPNREHRHRSSHRPHASRRSAHPHSQQSSYDSAGDAGDDMVSGTEGVGSEENVNGDEEPTETTPFLSGRQRTSTRHHQRRSESIGSTASAAPSLADTMRSLFRMEMDEGYDEEDYDDEEFLSSLGDEGSIRSSRWETSSRLLSRAAWRRYFYPMKRRTYYKSLLHLAVLNFPYALAAWVYLFVFTVTGTTLLIALPLGACLCFLNLLGARAFSRGELALQTWSHSPLAHAAPYPPRPIFTRYREPTTEELESGLILNRNQLGLVKEKSFYRNTYSMFTDPTSYQALFYFLVVKPVITLTTFLAIYVIGLPLFVLVLPAPAVLRATRRIGIWQASVALEGLYLAVR